MKALDTIKVTAGDLLLLVGFSCAYYVCARFGMTVFSLHPSNISLIWLPSGIGLVMMFRWGLASIPFIALPNMAANLPGLLEGHSLASALPHIFASTTIDTITPLVSMVLMRRVLPNGVEHTRDLVRFGFYICALPVMASSMLLTLNMLTGHYIQSQDASGMVRMLFLADSLGILLVYQIYLGWQLRTGSQSAKQLFCLYAAGGIAITLAVAAQGAYWLMYLVVPILVMTAFEVSLLCIALLSTAAMLAIITATANQIGPFVGTTAVETNCELMAFVFSSALIVFGISLQKSLLNSTEQARQQWQTAALLDPLTGLHNRRSFMPMLDKEHRLARQHNKHYAIAMLDIDDFKRINDSHGHPVGDQVLQLLALIIRMNCRERDVPVRMGGEEFAVLLPECDAQNAAAAMERVRKNFTEKSPQIAGLNNIAATVSIGIASYSDKNGEIDALVEADKALYMAKTSGKNRVVTIS